MSRVSFGSRAGGVSDYQAGHSVGIASRQSSVHGQYASLADLTTALKAELDAAAASEVPELTTCELSIQEGAIIPLLRPVIGPYADGGEHDLPPEYKAEWTDGTEGIPGLTMSLPKVTAAVILTAPDGPAKQTVQRAASRAIVQALEATDGFRYSFNNAWAAKDEAGLRFSYICQDSMQNKDRHANGFTKTQKHLKGDGERGPRKPTYDCKGSISVKFNASKRKVDVYYRHYAIHPSVADRKPPVRPSTGEGNNFVYRSRASTKAPPLGGLLGELEQDGANVSPPSMENHTRKRKRTTAESSRPLSLFELLQQSETAEPPPTNDMVQPKLNREGAPPPVEYNLPSWQAPTPTLAAPPPPPPAPLTQYHQTQPPQQSPIYGSYGSAPYPPPYQPQSYAPQPPVAIPRKSREEYVGVPSRQQHPQAQGLFSTLKPVRKEDFSTPPQQRHFVIYQANRAKNSCLNCRVSKKKCDEQRPMCGTCVRSGKVECSYEPGSPRPAGFTPDSTQHTVPTPQQDASQSPGLSQSQYPSNSPYSQNTYQSAVSSHTFGAPSQGPSQSQMMPTREASPDPWFPRR